MKGIQILMIIIFFLTEILQYHLLLNLMKNMVMSNEDKKKIPKIPLLKDIVNFKNKKI